MSNLEESQPTALMIYSYNSRSHPLPFMKASNVVAPAKVTTAAPDLEEAFEEEDDGEVIAEPKEDDEDVDLKKDKYIKQPKAKKATGGKKATAKKKAAKEDDEGSDGDVKPKKSKGKAKSKVHK